METQKKNGYRVLVVEDDIMMRRAFARALAGLGWEVVSASDPGIARDLYQHVDVVLSDWGMPAGGGARVLEESTKPVVIFTGAPQEVVGEPAEVFCKTTDFDLVNAALLQLAKGLHPSQESAAGK